MKKLLPLLLLSFSSCNFNTAKDNNQEDNIYAAKGNFGTIEIPHAKLDSILSSLPFGRLSAYKTIDSNKSVAVQLLRQELIKRNQEVEKYLILKIIENKDQTITFYLSHINQQIYSYHLEHEQDAIPITGNITGVEGWYTVDMKTDKISISYAQ